MTSTGTRLPHRPRADEARTRCRAEQIVDLDFSVEPVVTQPSEMRAAEYVRMPSASVYAYRFGSQIRA